MARKPKPKSRSIKEEIKFTELAARKATSKKASSQEKEFLNSFLQQLLIAKEKREKKRPLPEKRIALVEKKLQPSIMKQRKMREKLKSLTIEKEDFGVPKKKIGKIVEPTPEPTTSSVFEAPIFKRKLPPLPKPPKLNKEWPLPIPQPARPPEEEAMAPPTAELPFPEPPTFPAPIPTKPSFPLISIDLGNLNSFIQDKDVSVIECDGIHIPIKITKHGEVYETKIILSEDEIKSIIRKFADRAGEDLTEPIFKTTVANLSITAIISEFAGSKFVISKFE